MAQNYYAQGLVYLLLVLGVSRFFLTAYDDGRNLLDD
jgi:hypothetical protein